MGQSDRAVRMEAGNFGGALEAWRMEFAGREESHEATWELAEIEERWGDSLFFGGESGSAEHYRRAQRALFPLGAVFSSGSESDRRMEAHQRLVDKLYAVGPDGKARADNRAQPHPCFSAPPGKPISERLAAVFHARETRATQETGLDRLYRDSDHWRHHNLGDLWLDAARSLAADRPAAARIACQWSRHYFELYNKAWNAHMPASRWDSDGGAEIMDVQTLQDSLPAAGPESPLQIWMSLLLEGDWIAALAAFGNATPGLDGKPLAALLADACQAAGRQDDAQRVLAKYA